MSGINRKNIEDYFNNDWTGVLSSKSLEILTELTCKAYKLNLGTESPFNTEKPKPHDLGKI